LVPRNPAKESMMMTPHGAETLIEADVTALEYCEAAWDACDRELPAPDASVLSDLALDAIKHYGEHELPLDARKAVADEVKRRFRASSDRVSDALAFAALTLPALGGGTTAWMLLST
jgi:hypothetical protein